MSKLDDFFGGACMAFHVNDDGKAWHCLRQQDHDGDCDVDGSGHVPRECQCECKGEP